MRRRWRLFRAMLRLQKKVDSRSRRLSKPIDPGDTELLVYGECVECHWRAALPTGSRWPKCPGCGEQVLPPRGDDVEGLLRMGYVATLYMEREAFQIVREARS